MLNPMHRLWSDGRWNKVLVAHGCYWKKCSFCDITLDYIGRYDQTATDVLVDRIRGAGRRDGPERLSSRGRGRAACGPEGAGRAPARRGVTITWWGNIRFEKTFTPELCALLARRAAWR
jgi:radical SAM superfamily enzyme YgiQ (UPF0313 family)